MTQPPAPSASPTQFPHTLYHNDLSALPLGSLAVRHSRFSELRYEAPASPSGALTCPVTHPSWDETGCFKVIERGTGKYIETLGASPACDNRIIVAGDPAWRNYRLRAVVTPLDTEGNDVPAGICGVVARYAHARSYLALVLDRDRQLKLLQRKGDEFTVLAARPLEFCLGQSLTLTLTIDGATIIGTAGPYSGATHVSATLPELNAASNADADLQGGRVGYIADVTARFGPFSVECTDAETARLENAKAKTISALTQSRARYPKMKLERTIPLGGLVNGRNLRLVDVNGDGKPEIVLAQSSSKIAKQFSLTRLTCLTVLDLAGKVLWQAGVPDPDAPLIDGDLPFQVHDLYGDGGKIVVCVFGYDIQVRDGRSGKVLFSAATPETGKFPVGMDFKEVSSSFGAPWGDETENMNVSSIAFCRTLGSASREILVKDDYHHLAVLDALSDIPLQLLMRHRGNHGNYPWIGDIDGDGRDEILAGYSLLGAEGKRIGALPLSGRARAAVVLDPLHASGEAKRAIIAGDEGLIVAPLEAFRNSAQHMHGNHQGHTARLALAKFRSDVPGLQIATITSEGSPGIVRLHDACGRLLWTRELSGAGATGTPINWTGRSEELMLYSMASGLGLLDGHGDVVVEAPADSARPFVDVSSALSTDGRDAVIAWNTRELAVYVADDALKSPAHKPIRPTPENASNYRAQVSLPPEWR
jgi:rhamnogalacturonan endolyase